MERKSSINIKSCDETAALHNERVFAPDYLITESNIEVLDFDCNITKMKDKIINDYEATNRKGQYHKWQEKSVPIVEAVVNTKADTTMEELEQVKTMLMTEFGLDTMNISNHKDEGHFVITDDKTGYEYVVKRKDNKNFVRRDDGSSVSYKHTDEDGKGIEVYGKLKREYNHHAHFIINKYDFNTHKMVRLDKTDMIKMQTRVAEVLGMERGRFNSKAERLDHHKYTEIKTNENNNATLNLNGIELKIKDVKRFFKFNKKLAISLKNMEQADYTLLSQMQGQIGKKVKNKEYDSMTDFHKDLNKVIIGVLDKSERGITGSLKYDSEHRKKMVIALRKDFKKFMSNDTLDLENTLLIKKNKELKE
ncbi:MAG: hypothetical protein U9N59_15230, partial [Campylobacterota bacterium]|nr:hypothetical protein [Campylobacterota bacterium]